MDTEEIDVKSLAPVDEVKDETSNNEIFFEDFVDDDNFDDDDDKVLSEVYTEKKEAEKEEEAPKIKKKRERGVRKDKPKKIEEDDDPDITTDRYEIRSDQKYVHTYIHKLTPFSMAVGSNYRTHWHLTIHARRLRVLRT